MKKALLFISWLSLVFVPYHSVMATEASSFEAQMFEAHETILSQTVLPHKESAPLPVRYPGPEKESAPSVEMFVSWSRPGELDITEQNLGLDILGDRNNNNGLIVFSGDLNATAEPIFPTHSSFGYRLKGPNMDVNIGRAGPVLRGYKISGTYRRNDNTKPIYLAIYLAPTNNGWDISAPGMGLRISDEGYGSLIEGRINQNDIGKLELGILGACLGAVRYSPRYVP